MLHSSFLSSQEHCEIGLAANDWSKVTQSTLCLHWDLNLGPLPVPRLDTLTTMAPETSLRCPDLGMFLGL